MKILITGASGFVGGHLCQKLLEEGHTLFALVRTPSKMSFTHPQLFLIKGDLNLPSPAWSSELPEDLDACIHTAGIVHSYFESEFFQVNAFGTRYLIDSLKRVFPKQFKFLLISSLAAAGPCSLGEKKEETQIDFPISAYGRSKKQAEEFLKEMAPETWTCSIIRPPMVIGPGDIAVLDIFKMVQSRVVILPGINSLKKEYSFVCVFDLIESITRALNLNQSLVLYSAHDQVTTFKELIEEIKKQMNYKWVFYLPIPFFIVKTLSTLLAFIYRFKHHDIRLTPDKIHELKALSWTCQNAKSTKVLGQIYQHALSQTIHITYQDYKKRHWL